MCAEIPPQTPRTHPGLISVKWKAETTGTSKGNWKEEKKGGGGAGVGETEEKKGKELHGAGVRLSFLQIGSAARRCPRATCQSN